MVVNYSMRVLAYLPVAKLATSLWAAQQGVTIGSIVNMYPCSARNKSETLFNESLLRRGPTMLLLIFGSYLIPACFSLLLLKRCTLR